MRSSTASWARGSGMAGALLASAAFLAAPAFSAQPVQRPRVTGISHVAFRASDGTAARAFYGDLLGLSERSESRDGRLAYAVGARQSLVLEMGLPSDVDERLSHVAYETPDLEALSAHLRSRGFAVEQPATRCEESAVRVRDPDGHTIEFLRAAWPPPAADTPPGGALSTRILHAGVVVADEQRAHAFYRDALGFLEIWRGGRPEGVTRWVNMRVPQGTDYLEYMLVTDPPDRRQRGVLHHVCLRVPDMQAVWEEVARRATRFQREIPGAPQIGVNGRYQLNLYDQDGTRVELMEPFTVR